MLSARSEGTLRALTCGIAVAPDPLEHVDAALRTALRPRQVLAAIREALASEADLAHVIGLEHHDLVVRAYLRAVETRLRRRASR
jgi:hypothetical protein